jgi:hypothetical protein
MSSYAPGAVADSSCTSSTCTVTGGGNYCVRNLTLNAETGVFSGSLVTNACPNHAGAYEYNGVRDVLVRAASASCQKWTLPVAAYAAAVGSPKAAPLRALALATRFPAARQSTAPWMPGSR